MTAPIHIGIEDPGRPDVVALLAEHLADMHATSPAESVHALGVESLRASHVTFVAARDPEGALLGVGALARLDAVLAEIKSMRTARGARGRGVAAAVLERLLELARESGVSRVSLETGTHDLFGAAHRLYERHGFEPCGPFANYALDPHSRFYTRAV